MSIIIVGPKKAAPEERGKEKVMVQKGLSKKSGFFYSPAKIADGKPRFLRELCVFCCKNSIKRKINGQKRRGPAPSKRSTAMEKLVKRVFFTSPYIASRSAFFDYLSSAKYLMVRTIWLV